MQDIKKEYHKQYYLNNKEYFLEYRKQNYEKNKDRINQKMVCECGRVIIKRYYKKHTETKIHNTAYMQDIEKVIENENKNIIIKNDNNINNNNGWINFK